MKTLNIALPGNRVQTQDFILSGVQIFIWSCLLGLASQCSLVLPWSPIPLTGQTLCLFAMVTSLGKRSVLACFLYLLEGGSGLPFFAQNSAGWLNLVGPSGGYLIGFLMSTIVMSYLYKYQIFQSFLGKILLFSLGNTVILGLGTVWLIILGFSLPFTQGLFPFLIGDVIKIFFAAFLLHHW